MIKKSVKANSREITLNSLRQMFGKIYVDEHLLQRLKDSWESSICSDHIVKFVHGHSNIYSIVLVKIDGCIDYCEELIQKFDESDTQYTNIKETISYLEKIKDPRSSLVLQNAKSLMDAQVSKLNTEEARRMFIENVPWRRALQAV